MYDRYSYDKDYRLYLTKQDYSYPYLINPLKFLLDNLEQDNIPLSFVCGCLQNSMREILYIFLNHPFTPLLCNYYRNKFLRLLPLVEYLRSRGLELKDFRTKLNSLRNNVPPMRMTFLASLFGIFYEDFSSSLESFKKDTHIRVKPFCPIFKVADFPSIEKDSRYLEPLRRLQEYGEEKLSTHVRGFYLHGSFATMDYVRNWSDVDTLIILRKETLQDVSRLMRFQKALYNGTGYFYSIDPFQSHGFFVISDYDLEYFPETYFPLELFKYSKSFLKEDVPLNFATRDSDAEKMQILWRDVIHYARRMLVDAREKNRLDNYSIRMLLHRIYAFPVFYLQANGIHCYKKFSFDMARNYFTGEEWRPMEVADKVWREWDVKYCYRFLPQSLFCLSPVATSLCLRSFYRLKKAIFSKYNIDYWKLLVETNRLFETAWNRLLEEKPVEAFC